MLGTDLYTEARRYPENRIPVRAMRQITRQLLKGLHFLHADCKIIHTGMRQASNKPQRIVAETNTDLKPSNILIQLEDVQAAVKDALQDASGSTSDIVHLQTPLLTDMENPQLRIIDLGVGMCILTVHTVHVAYTTIACWLDKRLSNAIQPEHLRAPEVILGAPWGAAVDIWSLGCVVSAASPGQLRSSYQTH